MRAKAVVTLAALAAAAAAYGESVFAFDSGGGDRPDGYGAWLVTVNTAGNFAVGHVVRGVSYDCGTYALTQEENRELWEMVDKAGFGTMPWSSRPGEPDEVKYTFKVAVDGSKIGVELWKGDALKDKRVAAIVDYIATLIAAYTQTKPVLR